jgi:hypothetical protein
MTWMYAKIVTCLLVALAIFVIGFFLGRGY